MPIFFYVFWQKFLPTSSLPLHLFLLPFKHSYHYISKAPTLWGPEIHNQHTWLLFRKNFKRTCCIYFHGVAGVQWKWAHFLPPPVGSYSIYSSSDTCNSTNIYSLRQLNILTASPKENLLIAQKMSLVNTKTKYPDHEPDCTQAYRVDRMKQKREKSVPKRCSFQDLIGKESYSSHLTEVPASQSWYVNRHGVGTDF